MSADPSAPPLDSNFTSNDDVPPPSYAEATGLQVVSPAHPSGVDIGITRGTPPSGIPSSSLPYGLWPSSSQPGIAPGPPLPDAARGDTIWPPPPQGVGGPTVGWQTQPTNSELESHIARAATPENANISAAVAGAGAAGDAPPSYDSMFGHIKEAKESSSGVWDFFTILLAPVGCLVGCVLVLLFLGLILGLPITMLVVGSLYYHDCPVQPGIPIWLLIGGFVQTTHLMYMVKGKHGTCLAMMMVIFYLGWFIAGCALVYPEFPPEYERRDLYDDSFYCGRTVYITAFVVACVWSCLIALLCCVGVAV